MSYRLNQDGPVIVITGWLLNDFQGVKIPLNTTLSTVRERKRVSCKTSLASLNRSTGTTAETEFAKNSVDRSIKLIVSGSIRILFGENTRPLAITRSSVVVFS